jgi:hypothetical protein
MRRLGLRVLSRQYLTLLNRASRRPLLASEERERQEIAAALEQLQAMAPQGPLLARRGDAWAFEEPGGEELPA